MAGRRTHEPSATRGGSRSPSNTCGSIPHRRWASRAPRARPAMRSTHRVRSLSWLTPSVELWRPLLDMRRSDLLAYAREHALAWVEDESNLSARHDRNYLRIAV